MRTPWPDDFPPVFVHVPWRSNNPTQPPGLWDHPLYTPAKNLRDATAAIQLIDDIARDDVIEDIVSSVFYYGRGNEPIVIAPSPDLSEARNALAITYAEWLALELECTTEERVFQSKNVPRTELGAWARMAHDVEFYGEISDGADYIVVDDVMTLGGTLADLKGFIEHNGGRVICMSVLARGSGTNSRIALDSHTLAMIEYKFGNDIHDFCRNALGHETNCLTLPEAERLLECASIDSARAHLSRERDARNP